MLLGRTSLTRACSLPRFNLHRRLLTLQGKQAADFFRPLLPLVEVFPDQTSTSKNSIAILFHADRQAQKMPTISSINKNADPHYGPSLIGCPFSLLDQSNSSELGVGDMGILKAHRDYPHLVYRIPLRLDRLIRPRYIKALCSIQGSENTVEHKYVYRVSGFMNRLYQLFKQNEAIWFTAQLIFEKNHMTLRAPFIEFDDFAVHRVDALKEINERARKERDSNTAQAEDGGLFYKKLKNGGKVGSFGYGAGNAMATMDGLAMAGAIPANFLDGGGGANVANARLAIETLHRDSDVTSIFVNTFGGLTRCSLVAEGIIEAVKENNIKTPMTIRLMGTEADEAKEMLRATGLPFTIEDDFKTAAKLAVSQANDQR